MKVATFLLCGLLLASASSAQTDVSAWLTEAEIHNTKLQILRIPAEELPLNGTKNDIISAQKQMDKCRKSYEASEETNLRGLEDYILFIKNQNPIFPVNYFMDEWEVYIAYNKEWKMKDEDRQRARNKFIIDSFRIADMTRNYRFINKEFVVVKEKPDAKSVTLGKIYHGSYVKAYNIFDDKNHFIEVDIAGMTGYIQETDIAYTVKELEEMNAPEEVMTKVKDHPFYRFEASSVYQARLDREAAEDERAMKSAAPRRKYITGPRGGCYYINSHGNKEYVDRGYCR